VIPRKEVKMSSNWQPQVPVEEIKAGPVEDGPDGVKGSENESHGGPRKKVVVVGLGMVGISFM
jgi:nitrite reductase (NAD(P)H)